MSEADFQLHGIRDPRLAAHATSGLPAWVWSLNGAHILWANTIGARLFGERSAAALLKKPSVLPTRSAVRRCNSPHGCRHRARSGSNGCAASARRSDVF
jgi:hypothetical protein